MNEYDEYWQKEFASLIEEEGEPMPRQPMITSRAFFVILSALVISLIIGSVFSHVFLEQRSLYWQPSILIQGASFFGFLYGMVACFYLLERKGVLTEPIKSS